MRPSSAQWGAAVRATNRARPSSRPVASPAARPRPKVAAKVASMVAASPRLVVAMARAPSTSNRRVTETTMMAASTDRGRLRKMGASHSKVAITPRPAMKVVSWERAPARATTAERDRPAEAGKALKKAPARLAPPRANSSALG